MAKAIKIKIVPEIKVAPEKITPEKVDTSDLRTLLFDMRGFVENPGTVAVRQELVERLIEIIQKLES
jgi:hypothetical protein